MERTPGQIFMESSKYSQMGPTEESQGLPQPALVLAYPGPGPVTGLPPAQDLGLGKTPLVECIDQRRTLRRYSDLPLSQEELSFLLWTTQGVRKVTPRPATFRSVPSAGARHAFETYLLVNRVSGLAPGLYQYLPIEHQIGPLNLAQAIGDQVTEACLRQEQIRSSAATFFWVAVTERMRWRYDQRGYRYLHLDAGHVCQNLALAAESIGCGICPIAAFDDDGLNHALGLDGEELFVIYLAAVGKK
jgi:SagB-type dehydrogenase family enzyme